MYAHFLAQELYSHFTPPSALKLALLARECARGAKSRRFACGWKTNQTNAASVSLTISHTETRRASSKCDILFAFSGSFWFKRARAPPPIRFAQAKNKKYISREAPQKWFLLSARESISKPIVSGAILSARQNLPLALSLSLYAAKESIRAKIGGKRARTQILAAAQANSSEKKTWSLCWHVSAHDISYRMQSSPLSAAINILICTGPSERATATGNLMCQAKSAQHDGWPPPPSETLLQKKAHTICQLWKLIFETRFLLGIIKRLFASRDALLSRSIKHAST